jgi:molecular chaperone DnaJ
MFESEDYYEILGVSREASQEEIKTAFKKKAKKYHPDQSEAENAEEKFKVISEAYEVLSDEEMRQRYDRHGKEGVDQAQSRGRGRRSGGYADLGDILEEMGFGDISDFFGGRGGRSRGGRQQRGTDLRMEVQLDLEEAVHGTTKEFDVEKKDPCEKCDGSGSLSDDGEERCRTCDGRGKVSRSQGFFKITETCPDCRGRGVTIEDPCGECNGSGTVRRNQTIEAKIPAGVQSGQRVRVDGEGEPGRRGQGDLYLDINVKPHDRFKRKDAELYTQVPISFVQATLGGTVEVPLLGEDETETLDIPEGTQSGEVFVIDGKGAPRLKGRGRGDLHVQVKVVVPKDLSGEERSILEEFAEQRGTEVQKKDASFFNGVFDVFN